MYIPQHFSPDDEKNVRTLIEKNGFATILSFPETDSPFINHLPLIFSQRAGDERVLIGHMSKRNPQWSHFRINPKSTIIIHGPHTYITPKWFKSGRDVPTWNYAVAHLHGRIELVEDYKRQIEILKQLTKFYESSSPQPWQFELPDDLSKESVLTSAIISFRFHIEKVESKFKLSQNRSQADRDGIIEGLATRDDDQSRTTRDLMIEHERGIVK